jgi:hypothetical protein
MIRIYMLVFYTKLYLYHQCDYTETKSRFKSIWFAIYTSSGLQINKDKKNVIVKNTYNFKKQLFFKNDL